MSRLQKNFMRPDQMNGSTIAGIHLAGPNALKSAVVLLEMKDNYTDFLSVYEKIGSSGSLFSDERILSILAAESRLIDVMVDCPVSEPPCVTCTLPMCPGVVRCDDVSVAMMMALDLRRGRKGAHKLRPINPQNQRLWDVMYARGGNWGNLEPSYSANLAPLVVRAKTLQRRLRSLDEDLTLRETNIPILLSLLGATFSAKDWPKSFRNFERGKKCREEILTKICNNSAGPLQIRLAKPEIDRLSSSVEVFQAFLSAAMGSWRLKGLGLEPSSHFTSGHGWVDVLDINMDGENSQAMQKNREKIHKN